jgi:hypothetical protein
MIVLHFPAAQRKADLHGATARRAGTPGGGAVRGP